MPASDELLDLRRRMSVSLENCHDELIDLSCMKFHSSEEEMFLEWTSAGTGRLDFKMNSADPKDPKTTHAHKQFCKFIKVPYAFFRDNRPFFRDQIVQTWQTSLTMGSEKNQMIAKVRDGQELRSIRGLVSDKYSNILSRDIVDLIIQQDSYKLDLAYVLGDARDDLIFHAKILVGEEFEVQENKYRMGISVMSSDLGASDLVVDAIVHHIESDTDFVVTYGGESYFQSDYTGIQPKEFKEMVPAMLQAISEEWHLCQQSMESTKWVGLEASCRMVAGVKGVPTPFKRAIRMEADACADDMSTPLDFARHVSLVAKEYDFSKRLLVERAAGKYLNLSFEKV